MQLHGLKHLSEALGVAAWQSGLGTRGRQATLGMSLALHRLHCHLLLPFFVVPKVGLDRLLHKPPTSPRAWIWSGSREGDSGRPLLEINAS